jgi:hypothetical protein
MLAEFGLVHRSVGVWRLLLLLRLPFLFLEV